MYWREVLVFFVMKFKLTIINGKAEINTQKFVRGFTDLVRETGREAYKYFDQSTSAFHNHKVTISQLGIAGNTNYGGPETVVGVLRPGGGNIIYSYVNWGTGARWIYPRTHRPMIFRVGYRPATHRGSLPSGGTWQRTGPWQVAWKVSHITEPRRFDEFIQMATQAHMNEIAPKRMRAMLRRSWGK